MTSARSAFRRAPHRTLSSTISWPGGEDVSAIPARFVDVVSVELPSREKIT